MNSKSSAQMQMRSGRLQMASFLIFFFQIFALGFVYTQGRILQSKDKIFLFLQSCLDH